MSAGDSGPGDREVAVRVFAAEYDDAELSYSESDEERAPNYVVTPTGARVNRLFAVGVLTEVEPVNEEMLRARVVDPTGAFVVYAGQYQPDALAFLERTDPPAFVAVTGKARTFEPDDADRIYTSVRPESISAVDAETRDRWVVQTAEQTLDRVRTMAGALAGDARGEDLAAALREQGVAEELAAGVPRAIDHYGTTPTYLAAVRDLAVDALRVVTGDREEADRLDVAPGDPGEVTAADLTEGAVAATTAPVTDDPGDGDEPAETAGTTAATGESDVSEPAAGESDASEPTADESDVDGPAAGEPDVSEQDVSESTDEPDAGAAAETPDADPVEEPGPGQDAETVAGEASVADADGTDAAPTAADEDEGEDELGDFDGEFDLDEEERREIEEEYGTEFSTGSEVEEPGEADIEPEAPQPDEESTATEPAAGSDEGDTDAPEPAPAEPESTAADAEPSGADATGDESAASDAPDGDVDLDDAVLETMRDLDDGDGADREAVVSAVVERYGADREAVEDTIQDALMSGQCYEPAEDTLKAI